MNKLKPRNKYFQNYKKLFFLKKKKLYKLKKKKWFFLKKNLLKNKNFEKNLLENRKLFFKNRLIEKQQFKFFYGCLSEYKLKNIFKKIKNKQNILDFFIFKIESRLDINILKFKKAKSIFHAQQLINHKKILINNKIINKLNYILKLGDIITLVKKNKQNDIKKN